MWLETLIKINQKNPLDTELSRKARKMMWRNLFSALGQKAGAFVQEDSDDQDLRVENRLAFQKADLHVGLTAWV